jgi:DNA polymerase III subunit chi
MEINFYQISADDVNYKAMAPLLLKILEEQKKACIYCSNEAELAEIDAGLWSFSKTKFIPHATLKDGVDANRQPVFIDQEEQNHNKAEFLVMMQPVSDDFLNSFERVFYFFNDEGLQEARKQWKIYKEKSFALNFYKKEKGKWGKINI